MSFSSSKNSSQNQSQQTSQSLNQAYPFLQGALGSQVGSVATGSNAIADLLGLNGAGASDAGFQKFKDSSGYNFIQGEGLKGITSNNAAKGLLGSGSALKGITNYTTGLASNFLDSYLKNLQGLSSTGLQSAQILSSAGNTANSQGTSAGTSTGSSMGIGLK